MQSLWKTVWRFLKKLKTEVTYDPAFPLLGMYPAINTVHKDTCTPMFTAVLFTTVKACKQPKFPLTEEWYIYTMEWWLLFSH